MASLSEEILETPLKHNASEDCLDEIQQICTRRLGAAEFTKDELDRTALEERKALKRKFARGRHL